MVAEKLFRMWVDDVDAVAGGDESPGGLLSVLGQQHEYVRAADVNEDLLEEARVMEGRVS